MRTRLLERLDPARPRTEQMVRDIYREAYGARIESFPALMAVVIDARDRPLCAAGIRTAACGFFSECYLDRPVEFSIGAATGDLVDRDRVLEVTTLAARERGLALDLVGFVIERGRLDGMRWGMFTATAPLRRALARAGFALHVLAPALASRVADPGSWGRYYEMRPSVCAVTDPRRGAPRAARSATRALAAGAAAVA